MCGIDILRQQVFDSVDGMANPSLTNTKVNGNKPAIGTTSTALHPKVLSEGLHRQTAQALGCEKFKPIRESKPKDEAHRPDYYTHSERGERDETVEDTLEEVESRAAPVIPKLANPQFTPTKEQMGHVYLFTAFMIARVPSWRENLDRLFSRVAKERHVRMAGDKERFHKMCADMEQQTGKPLGMDVEEMRQYILKGEYEIVQSSVAYNLRSMFESALSVAQTLQEFSYEVLYAPQGHFFLTSDCPVFTLLPEGNKQASVGMGFGWPKVLVHFPLNKRACLRLRRGVEPAAVGIGEYDLGQINRITMANATRYLYSSEGHRRISRLFDQWGCKIEAGKNAYMPVDEPSKHRYL